MFLRTLHTTTARSLPPKYGFAFDIDGVLIKVSSLKHPPRFALASISRASPHLPARVSCTRATMYSQRHAAIQLLNGENPSGRRIPWLLLTNGGGITEDKKAEQLSKKLGVHISPQQLVLSHSPMKALIPTFENTPVLVVGGAGHSCREVAERYGFRRVIQPNDILGWQPAIWPFRELSEKERAEAKSHFDFAHERIGAIMVFHDSRDWGRDMQVMIDILRSQNGIIGTVKRDTSVQDVPLYFSN
ncbi:Haloacid dehalogenase-like hydrolase-domain-containing protein, partial [Jimgerdemannia flammicorona]